MGASRTAPSGSPSASNPAVPGPSAAGSYPPPADGYQAAGPATAQFPVVASTAPEHSNSALLTALGQAAAEAPAGPVPAPVSAGSFAPSAPAWLTRGQPSGSGPAGSGLAGPGRSRTESSALSRRRRRRAPESGDAPFPAEPAASERPQPGRAHSGRWIPFAAAAVVLVVCAVTAAILLSQGKTPPGPRPARGSPARHRHHRPASWSRPARPPLAARTRPPSPGS